MNLRFLTKSIVLLLALSACFSSCQQQDLTETEESVLKRMPYNEKVFFLDSRSGWSHVYELTYDFQGLQGDAVLKPFVKVAGGSHMTVSPIVEETGERYLTIVNGGQPGKIHLVNVNDATDHRILDLYEHSGQGSEIDTDDKNRVRITQVDYDQNNFLFIAGKSGFFRVSADYADMQSNLWTEGLEGTNDEENLKVWAVKMSNNGGIEMVEEDADEDYFDEGDAASLKRPKFVGGDILFTQNSEETGAFEEERLISVTQAHGNSALWVELEFAPDGKAVRFSAKKLFNLMKVVNKPGERGIGKVTGAALIGDNHLITSHHFTDGLEVRNLSGELLASPKLVLSEDVDDSWATALSEDGYLKHNWGDMASVQTFDAGFTATARTIPTATEDGYFPFYENADIAEVELYRPGSAVLSQYEVADDNPEVSKVARRNSSNSDIADLRTKPAKFASLGKDNGFMILKFNSPITVTTQTTLQVVETSWNKKTTYEDKVEAYKAYAEQASVYVSNYPSRYIGDWIDDASNWTKVGDAYISSNLFSLEGIESFQWVKIVDDNSKTPDGFDVNFVATFEAP